MNYLYIRNKLFNNPLFLSSMILILASIFRMFYMDLIEYKYDEALTILQVNNFFSHPYIIQKGLISTVKSNNFPLFHYLIITLSAISRNPQFVSFLIASINAIFVVVFYFCTKKNYSNKIAIFASILYCVSFWDVLYSRKIWAIDLIPFFSIPFFYFIYKLIVNKDIKASFPVFILLALLIQLHGSGIFLALTQLSFLLS